MKGILRALAVVGLLLGNTACLLWPAPTGDLLEGRGRIRPDYVAPLEVGKATQEDVLMRLGEPDDIQEGGHMWVYRWVEVRGFFALIGSSNSLVIPFPGPREVRVRFREGGVLSDVALQVPREPEHGGEAP